MNRQQYNETIKKVISSPRSDLQKMNMLENAFALYVKEETDRIVGKLEELLKLAREAHRSEEGMNDEYLTIILERYRGHIEMLKTAIDIVKGGGEDA